LQQTQPFSFCTDLVIWKFCVRYKDYLLNIIAKISNVLLEKIRSLNCL
jgi:hypothetical protein